MRLLDDLVSLSLVCGVFLIAPGAIGLFLAIGLRRNCEAAVPRSWWVLMSVTCTLPLIVVTLGLIFQADRPQFSHQHENGSASLLGLAIVASLLILPLVLIRSTNRLSDRRNAAWEFGATVAPLILLPIDFIALLAAAQLTSGVSL